jgi:sulfite oxidase
MNTMHRRHVLQGMGAALLALGGPRVARADSVSEAIEPAELLSDWRPAAVELDLVTRLKRPFCAEPALSDLIARRVTPARHLYVLCHGAVPQIDQSTYVLRVEGEVERPLALSLERLVREFRAISMETALTCAGNRRREHHARKKLADPLLWGPGAIGNPRWTGLALAELLTRARPRAGARHVWFEGLDDATLRGRQPPGFGASIPLARVHEPLAEPVLLAYAMNGAPLSRVHGYPLRSVVPGYIGARSVKWLGRIVVSSQPSNNPYFQRAHRLIGSGSSGDKEPIYSYPLNAAICTVSRQGRAVDVRGYALPPGKPGCTIERVELSVDHGRSWARARIDSPSRPYAWCLWQARLRAPPDARYVVVRAFDSEGNAQPRRAAWNTGGYLNNGWHSVPLPG